MLQAPARHLGRIIASITPIIAVHNGAWFLLKVQKVQVEKIVISDYLPSTTLRRGFVLGFPPVKKKPGIR
jgi:hypothetical protein